MIERLAAAGCAVAVAVLVMAGTAASQAQQAAATKIEIGYVQLAQDPRYDDKRAYARIQLRPLGHPFPAAQVGIAEAEAIGRVLHIDFSLRRHTGNDADDLAQTIETWLAGGVHFIIADLPAKQLLALSDRLSGKPVLLFNTTDAADSLRGQDCRADIVHMLPSEAMQSDALVQYLVAKKWRKILVLKGSSTEDSEATAALQRSAKRFGATVSAVKPFQLSNDPRHRDQNNISLMTADGDYDVLDVIDSDGDFARYVPYAINHPRPVVGSAGLVAAAWHWSWDSHGAPQLNHRFEVLAGRRMDAQDWATWAAVKAVVQASLRVRSGDFEKLKSYLLSERMTLDGYKGNPMSVRPWDQQLRQPMLLATANAVIARAPIPGFLHQTNELDTLGMDRPESRCHFAARE